MYFYVTFHAQHFVLSILSAVHLSSYGQSRCHLAEEGQTVEFYCTFWLCWDDGRQR